MNDPSTQGGSLSSERPLIIQAQGVSKQFGDFQALANLNLEVHQGDCVGLLGPNGAGKSTFIGCLYGVVLRNGGELKVFGHDPDREARAIKQRLGVVPQENALDEELTVQENLRLYARFEEVPAMVAACRIDQLLADMTLHHKASQPIKTLSGGMKRRLAFVRSLLSDPELLILDEPTTGLDPAVRHLLWEKIISYKSAGKTVLVTTHYMHEAELLCDRIVILDHGRIVASGAPRDLITAHTPGFVAIFPQASEHGLQDHLPPAAKLYQQGWQTCVRLPDLESLTTLQQNSGLLALQMRPANLEDVYLSLTGEELSDDA